MYDVIIVGVPGRTERRPVAGTGPTAGVGV